MIYEQTSNHNNDCKNPKGFDVCRQVCRKDVMERSEMESFRNACNRYASVMHSSGMRHHQISFCQRSRIPLGCILLCDICRHFASAMLHFASLISHNLRCIPAYTHQIPNGISCHRISSLVQLSKLYYSFGVMGWGKILGDLIFR